MLSSNSSMLFYMVFSDNYENMDEKKQIKFDKFIFNKVEKIAAQNTYNWKPIDYSNIHVCRQYLLSRISPEYNVIKTIFNEIQQRDPDFSPESLFDFGSGIGTVTMYVISIFSITFYYVCIYYMFNFFSGMLESFGATR